MKLFALKERRLRDSQQRFAERLALAIVSTQRRLADDLNGRTRNFTRRRWLWLLLCFCLLAGGYCLYLVAGNL